MDIESTANRLASPDKPGEIWAGVSIDVIVDALREMSAVTDARELVEVFTDRVGTLIPQDRFVYISRRGLPAPKYRVTRCSEWEDSPDPWTEAHKLPVLEGGFMGDLVFSNEPHLIPELRVDPDDPSAEYFEGMGSLIVIPQYENRESINVMMLMRRESHAFDAHTLPLMVWTTNLFGRSVHMLRLGDELKNTYDLLDLELKSVADVQRSLLPKTAPEIRTLELAAYCEMAQRAGGDYYDFLPLQNGNWGILIADVCGHGPAAAVLMAITHSIVHTAPKECDRPGRLLAYMNDVLVANYTTDSRTFVTAFYGVYDPQARAMTYSSAGHLPPRLYKTAAKRLESLESPPHLPLGVEAKQEYSEERVKLDLDDLIVFYTDGVTETRDAEGRHFDLAGIDTALSGGASTAEESLLALRSALDSFSGKTQPEDDRAVVIAKVR